MENKEIKEENYYYLWFIVIGIILMIIGAVWMFFATFTVFYERLYIDYFNTPDVEIFKSPALGILSLGFISYLIGKEVRTETK